MTTLGKSLALTGAEVEELLSLKYVGQRTFPVLSLLYPGLDLTKSFHEDHVFPRSRFTGKRLREAGVPVDDVAVYQQRVDQLPNLQLLPGLVNIEKQAALPQDWLRRAFPNSDQLTHYLIDNDLDDVPLMLEDFLEFFEIRRTRMAGRLRDLLGVDEGPVDVPVDQTAERGDLEVQFAAERPFPTRRPAAGPAEASGGGRRDIAAVILQVLHARPGEYLTSHDIVKAAAGSGHGQVSSGAVSNVIKADASGGAQRLPGVRCRTSPVSACYLE